MTEDVESKVLSYIEDDVLGRVYDDIDSDLREELGDQLDVYVSETWEVMKAAYYRERLSQ